MNEIDAVQLNFSDGGLLFMNITLCIIMFGIALEIKIEHFKNILKNPTPALVGIFSQFLLLPAATVALIYLLKPQASMALGMILVAACPGGNISNFIAHLAKGNTALSVSLTAFATLSSVFLTPFNFAFWGSIHPETTALLQNISLDIFDMFKTVFLLLGLPLVSGMLFAKRFPIITAKISKPIKIFGVVAFLGFVLGALVVNWEYFKLYILSLLFIVVLHNITALFCGFSLSKMMKLSSPDTRSITIETGIQNSGLGLILIFNFFDGLGGMAMIAACWGMWHMVSGLTIAAYWGNFSPQSTDDRP